MIGKIQEEEAGIGRCDGCALAKLLDETMFRRPIEPVGSTKGIALQIVQYVAPCLQEPVPLRFDRGCIFTDQLKVGSLNLNRVRFSSSGVLRPHLPFTVPGTPLQPPSR